MQEWLTIVGEEGRDGEAANEGGVAVGEDDQSHADKANPPAVGLKVSAGRKVLAKGIISYRSNNVLIGKGLPIKALSFACVIEREVSDGHDNVVDDTTGRDEVDEPIQDQS
jgi:hypothetical protein